MLGRALVIALAVVAVAVAFVTSGKDDGGDRSRAGDAAAQPGPNAVRISFYYSPEKERLLAPLVERFNASGARAGGKGVFVDARNISSGEAQDGIATGKLKPVLWTPASSLWGRLLNYQADQALVADENPSLVRTPLVIAMWEELADGYGYPGRPLGYEQLAELAVGGWAAAGRPQFGPFKYVHANPDFSTSGLSAVAASYYAAAGKREGLTVEDIARTRGQVKRLERSIVHYGDTTLALSEEMSRHGTGYTSAIAMEEITLIEFNREAGDGPKLVAVYPEEGTFVSDNPLITLQGDWVTREQRQAARVFSDYLKRAVTPEVAGRYGFRPADQAAAPAGLVSAANGVDPAQPERVLSLPEPRVLARIKEAWREDRKPANVMIVLDNSDSMSLERKLDHAKEGLRGFLAEAAPHDRIGLIKFSAEVHELVPIAPMSENRKRLLNAIDDIFPEEDTRVRDAIVEGVKAVERKLDKDAINAVVALTDGADTASDRSVQEVVEELAKQGERETGQIRVFTIAYGKEPNDVELGRYAQESGGKLFLAGTQNIETVYRTISSFF
jgi:Ca-activated chloride channel family protein